MSQEYNKIIPALIKAMRTIDGVEKSLTVGTGNNSYKATGAKDVFGTTRKALYDNGLALLPSEYHPNMTVDQWEEESHYGKKRKQQVFVEMEAEYTLYHESGQHVSIPAYGHGIDSQDKAAGKATTYALKYALIYLGLIPTGDIDDTDKTPSKDIEIPKKKLKEVTVENLESIKGNLISLSKLKAEIGTRYSISEENEKHLDKLIKECSQPSTTTKKK